MQVTKVDQDVTPDDIYSVDDPDTSAKYEVRVHDGKAVCDFHRGGCAHSRAVATELGLEGARS